MSHKLFEESLGYFEKVLTIEKENNEALQGKFNSYIGIAENLLEKQEYKNALNIINKSLKINSENPKA